MTTYKHYNKPHNKHWKTTYKHLLDDTHLFYNSIHAPSSWRPSHTFLTHTLSKLLTTYSRNTLQSFNLHSSYSDLLTPPFRLYWQEDTLAFWICYYNLLTQPSTIFQLAFIVHQTHLLSDVTDISTLLPHFTYKSTLLQFEFVTTLYRHSTLQSFGLNLLYASPAKIHSSNWLTINPHSTLCTLHPHTTNTAHHTANNYIMGM